MEQAERLAVVLAVLTADCSAEPLAELLEPRSKHANLYQWKVVKMTLK